MFNAQSQEFLARIEEKYGEIYRLCVQNREEKGDAAVLIPVVIELYELVLAQAKYAVALEETLDQYVENIERYVQSIK